MNPPEGETGVVRVAAIELPQEFGAVARSLARIDRALSNLAPTDLALLPETIVTGYLSPRGECDLAPFAEAPGGAVTQSLSAMARRHNIALAGPVIERIGALCFNALVLFDRDGELRGRWHKRHPWVIEHWASPGTLGSPVVDLLGIKITAAICYDLHSLEHDAGAALDASDVLLFPTAWVDDVSLHPDLRASLLPPIARAHQVVIVNANWARSAPRLAGQGASRIIGRRGEELSRVVPGGLRVASAKVSKSA